MMFRTDIKKLGTLSTPSRQRKSIFLALLHCLISPVQTYQNEFETNRESNLYKLNHNGQICKLAGVLNDTFDKVERRIYITGSGSNIIELIDRDSDQNLVQLPLLINRDSDYADSGFDFIVWMPNDFVLTIDSENHLKSVVDYYKLAGKRYKINIL